MSKKKKVKVFDIVDHVFFIILSMTFIIPVVMVVSASFTSESWLSAGKGFSILPHEFTTSAYKSAFVQSNRLVNAYVVTIAQAVLGTLISTVVAGMTGYSLSRKNFCMRKPITICIFITMLFSVGMIPTYIIFSQIYHLTDNFLIYILPGMMGGAWNTLVFRTFFKSLPESLFESARLDGAKELRIFFSIAVPLSTPAFASISFLVLVAKWNNYTTSMIYIRKESLYTIQYLLQRMMAEAEFIKSLAADGKAEFADLTELPSESLKYAMCVIAAAPMLCIFPFFQKYFSRGLTIGAVKE